MDLSKNKRIQEGWGFLKNRRPDTYQTADEKATGKVLKMSKFKQTCRELGYRMPAEWEKHDAIWLAWPYDPTTLPQTGCNAWKSVYVQIVKEIHESENVNLFVNDETTKKKTTEMFKEAGIDL